MSFSTRNIIKVAAKLQQANNMNVYPLPNASIKVLVMKAKIRMKVKRVKLAQLTPAS